VGRLCACNAVGSIVLGRNSALSRLWERTHDKPMDDRVAECQRDGPLQSSMGIWRLGVGKTCDIAEPKTTTPGGTSRGRNSGPGGMRGFSMWPCQRLTEPWTC